MTDIILTDKIKRYIRSLKKAEIRIACGSYGTPGAKNNPYGGARSRVNYGVYSNAQSYLVWDRWFDLGRPYKGKAKYNLDDLAGMGADEFESAVAGYFDAVLTAYHLQAPPAELFPVLNIPVDSDAADIKKRFRELAKKVHPDTGGSHEAFLELYKAYEDTKKSRG